MKNRKPLLYAGLFLVSIFAYKTLKRNRRKIDFNGKVVLLTGASRGLGLVMARELVKQGAILAICGRDAERLEKARVELESLGAEVLAFPCDLTDPIQRDKLIDAVVANYNTIDILINNAGTDIVSPIENTTTQDFEDLMNLHFWAPLHLSQRVIPLMKEKAFGRIVNISSIGGKITMPHMAAYSSSKHALVGLSDGLRAEYKKNGILVTTVCPGFLRTGTQHNVSFKGNNKKEFAWSSYVISLPITSMSAVRAAKKIIRACKYGDAELVMPFYAKALSAFRVLAPELTMNFSSTINSLLPSAGGIGAERALGNESYSPAAPSFATMLSDKAAKKNNQL